MNQKRHQRLVSVYTVSYNRQEYDPVATLYGWVRDDDVYIDIFERQESARCGEVVEGEWGSSLPEGRTSALRLPGSDLKNTEAVPQQTFGSVGRLSGGHILVVQGGATGIE